MTAFNLIASFSVFTVFRQFLQSVRHPSLRPFTPFPQIEWSHHSPELNFLLGRVESWSNFTNITWTSTLSFAYAGPQILFHDFWPAVLCDGVCQRRWTLLPLVQRETILRGENITWVCPRKDFGDSPQPLSKFDKSPPQKHKTTSTLYKGWL